MNLDLSKLEKMIDNKEFVEVLEMFLPKNYEKLTSKEKNVALNKMEGFLAKYEDREPCKVRLNDGFLNYSYTGLSSPKDAKPTIFIKETEKEQYKSFDTLASLIHQGAHLFLEKEYDKVLGEKEKEMYELDKYESIYNKSYLSFAKGSTSVMSNAGNFIYTVRKRHYLDPQEFFASKFTYKLGMNIFNSYAKKQKENYPYLVLFIQMTVSNKKHPLSWYASKNYEKNVYPKHLVLTEYTRQLRKKEKEIYKSHKEIDEKILKNHQKVLEKSKDANDLSVYFFPTVWDKLSKEEKEKTTKKVLDNLFLENSLTYKGNGEYISRKKGFNALATIYATFFWQGVCKKEEFEFITIDSGPLQGLTDVTFMDFNKTSLKKAYENYLNDAKNYKEKWFPYPKISDLEESFFFLPQSQLLHKTFIKKLDKSFKQIEKIYDTEVLNMCDDYKRYKEIIKAYNKADKKVKETLSNLKEEPNKSR